MPAVAHPLGPRLALYSARPLSWREFFLVYLPGILVVLVSLVNAYSIRNISFLRYGPAAAEAWSRPWFLISGLGLLDLLLLTLVRIHRARGYVAVHKRGLQIRLATLRPQTYRWAEISGLVYGAYQEYFLGRKLRTVFRAELLPNLGRPIRLDRRVEDVPGLVECLKAALYPRLLPALTSDFQIGRWVHFGVLRLHQGGLSLRGRFPHRNKQNPIDPHAIPWESVSALRVDAGDLVIELDHKDSLHLPVATIPNLELLLQIVATGVNPTHEAHANS